MESNIELYDSSFNVSQTDIQSKTSKQVFVKKIDSLRIPPNKSGKILVQFGNLFQSVPFVSCTISVKGTPLSVSHSFEQLCEKSVIIHLENADQINENICSVLIKAETF